MACFEIALIITRFRIQALNEMNFSADAVDYLAEILSVAFKTR